MVAFGITVLPLPFLLGEVEEEGKSRAMEGVGFVQPRGSCELCKEGNSWCDWVDRLLDLFEF